MHKDKSVPEKNEGVHMQPCTEMLQIFSQDRISCIVVSNRVLHIEYYNTTRNHIICWEEDIKEGQGIIKTQTGLSDGKTRVCEG